MKNKTKQNEEQTESNLAIVKDETQRRQLRIISVEEIGGLDLEGMVELPIELVGNYWTPLEKGESKKMVFWEVGSHTAKNMVPGQENEDVQLEAAFFMERGADGITAKVINASKRLVSSVRHLKQGTPISITYQGKKKNANNQFMSDSWSLKYLV